MLVELVIHAAAGTGQDDGQSMILLKEKNGDRILPILTSARKASVLLMRQQFSPMMPLPLPMSPADISCLMMRKFGIQLSRVELTALHDGAFLSRIVAEREGEVHTVDFCQAPDGLIMATSARCPIMIEEQLLEAQYMHPTGKHSFALNINTLSRKMLEDALKYAVETENYESASRLRDELARRNPQPEQPQE